jgi:integrase
VNHLRNLRTKTGKPFSDKYVWNIVNELKGLLRFPPIKELSLKPLSFPKITFQTPPIRWLRVEQQNQVFEFIPQIDLPIFTFMRWTGCRLNEAAGLLRENVFLKEKYLVLATAMGNKGRVKPNTKTKIAKPLPIIPEIEWTLHPKVISNFVFTRNGRPYSKWMLQKAWHKASLNANKKYKTPVIPVYQGLKHSFGCQRLNSGFSIHQVQSVMGHTSSRTTERYAQYSTEKLADVMRGKVHRMFTPSQDIQAIENIRNSGLGGKDSNLG